MPDSKPLAPPAGIDTPPPASRNLLLRIASAAVLAPIAIAATYFGGIAFTLLWTLAGLAIWWEWVRLVQPAGNQGVLATGFGVILIEGLLAASDHLEVALIIAALGALATAITSMRHAVWIAAGAFYASAPLLASVALRGEDRIGLVAILFVFAVVWGTDIVAYFVGRAIGGPKLVPAISPKKTWSGAIGGTLAGIAGGLGVILAAGGMASMRIIVIAFLLSVVAQIGDLFESGIKRHFEVKDSSSLIPGHGGVMDRLDGYIFAVPVAVLIGIAVAGLAMPAVGLIGR
jgi:phosphatidate cytidylyltransferase